MDIPRPGWAEQNPNTWWETSVNIVKEVLEKSKVDSSNISAIGISGQMHGSVFIDKQGNVIRPALLWCDQRTQPQCDTISNVQTIVATATG